MIIKNDQGEDIEVFTPEEAEKLAADKVAEAEAAKQAEIDLLNTEKAEKEAELEKEKQKDKNFDRFRKLTEEERAKEKAANEDAIKKQIEEINKKLEGVATQPINDAKAEFIKTYVGIDKERNERFEYYYKRLGADAKTKEEVTRAATEALTLATNGEVKPDATGKIIGTGVSADYRGSGEGRVSEVAKEMGNQMGISEADRKKYGKKNV